ncbi:putative exported protein [Halobacteriovorax marinus SJ]|uniref:Exported protein n=1 Tax=Halobacteriovorax marinus (strain ATCC BAA-682 / DSM 15412 / SJ) TaxID=862908 RepID=E1X4T2_HALMS|nr:hypothetical protein [Halobacteriovorax marinus]CBW27158.1 putative exported protein [Halobacteriovorax marinus SJ]
MKLFLLIIFSIMQTHASEEWYNYERIMLIKSKSNFILDEGLITYSKSNKWYIPLEDLFDSIGANYKYNKNERVIQGFIFKKSNVYKIDLNECVLYLKNRKEKFECNDFIPLEDYLLLSTPVVEKLIDIKIKIDSLSSSMTLEYHSLFPPEEKEKRSERKIGKAKRRAIFPVEKNERDWIDGFNFDQDISGDIYRSQSGDSRGAIRHETSLSAEFLKSELYTDYRGVDRKQESFWLSLERNDYRNRIFGDVGLSEVKVVNFNLPTTNLVGGGQKLTGIYFSNRSLYKASNFTKEDFSGPLEKDWEVELYQNDILIARELGTAEKQRYEFNGVDLYYGMNRFKFIFYGPKGERRYESKNLNITDAFIEADKLVNVAGAYGFDENDKENYSLSLSKNLFKRVQFELNTVKSYEYTTGVTTNYFGGSLNTFLNSTLLDLNYINDGENRAIETALKFNTLGVNTNLSYINNSGVKSSILGHSNPVDYSWNANFLLPLRFIKNLQTFNRISYKKKIGIDDNYTDFLNRISLSIRNFYISNSMSVENTIFTNEIFTRYNFGKSSFKFKNRWGKEGLRDSELSYTFSNRKKNSYSSALVYAYEQSTTNLRFRADRRFRNFFAGVSLDVGNKGDYGAGVNLSYGLVYDEDTGINLYNKRTTEYSNIKASAFHDLNGDGIRNDNEELIRDVEFYRLSGNERESTNHTGYAFFSFVQPFSPTDIKISLTNIQNIYLRPKTLGKRVWGRVGKTASVEFPLQIEGDIEGEIDFIDGNKRKKITANLVSNGKILKRIHADKDGYFYSGGIKPGKYTLKVICDDCDGRVFEKTFNMPKEGDSLFLEGVRI